MSVSNSICYYELERLKNSIDKMSSRLRVRYWVGVMSKDQVSDAVKKGYCEFKNGSKKPFKHVNPHSWFVLYSPGTKSPKLLRELGRDAGEKVQAFTAIGQVLPGDPYSVDLGNDEIVFRRNARFVPNVTEAPLAPLMSQLSFFSKLSKHQPWGVPFRKGLIELLKSDFYKLCEAMNIDMPKRHNQIFEQTKLDIKKVEERNEIHRLGDAIAPVFDNNKGNSTSEDRQSLNPNRDTNGEIIMEGLPQEQQETNNNNILKVWSDNANPTNMTMVDDNAGKTIDPMLDDVREMKAEVVNQQEEEEVGDIHKENNITSSVS